MAVKDSAGATFLSGGGDLEALIRGFDWSSSKLGAPETWPEALKTTLGICLNSSLPSAVYWGEELIILYNDAWAANAAGRHPWSLGRPAHEARADLWPVIAPQFADVIATGKGYSTVNQMLPMERGGRLQETWWNYSVMPIHTADGVVGGVFTQGYETTASILVQGERDLKYLRLQEMFDHTPSAIALLSEPDHRFDIANKAFLDLVGRDVRGRTVSESLPEIAEQGYVEMLDRITATGEPFIASATPVSIARRGPDAHEVRVLDFILQPMRGPDGETTEIFIEVVDITDRARAESALRESEERFRLVAETAPVKLWMADAEGACLYLNKAQRDFWGVEPDDVPAFDWRSTVHPDDVQMMSTPFELAMATQTGFGLEARYRRADGAWRILRTNAQPRFDSGGAFLGMIGVNVDVTDRRAAELALRDSEERFRGIANSVDQMIWSTLPDGRHDYFNQRWYDFTGAARAPSGIHAWDDMCHPDDRERVSRVWRSSLETGEPWQVECRLRRRADGYRWVLGRGQPVRNEAAQIVRWFGSCTDIQDIVEARDVLARSREELEREVDERTAKLMEAEEQLRQAMKMEALGQLTGGIAHDFNNMLAVVIGGLSLLQRRLAQGETDVEKYVVGAMEGARRAAALTERLLAFSRQQPLAPEPVDANQLVQGMTDMLSRTLGEAVTVETVLATDLWKTHADVNQLENVVLNLAVNGRDAMPDGGRLLIETANVSMDVEMARELGLEPGDYVLLAVSDSGTGMPPEVIAKAFDPFFTTKEVGKGTGLGLSQVFGFIRQSGGHVMIKSEVGVGTSVKTYLPRLYAQGRHPQSQPHSPVHGGRAGEVILVVEDDDRVRTFSCDALRELGYGVIEATGGAEALSVLETSQPVSLLFTDVVMPVMTGPQLAAQARRQRPDIKVLFTTGYMRDAATQAGALSAGAQTLLKPFSIDQLAVKVRAALDS